MGGSARTGPMESAVDSGSSSLALSPGRGHSVVFFEKKNFTLTVRLSIQKYKRALGELLGQPDRMLGTFFIEQHPI